MSSAAPPPDPNLPSEPEKQPEGSSAPPAAQDAPAEMDTTPDQPAEDTFEDIPADVMELSTDEILTRIRLIDNDIKVRHIARVLAQTNRVLGNAFRDTAFTA